MSGVLRHESAGSEPALQTDIAFQVRNWRIPDLLAKLTGFGPNE